MALVKSVQTFDPARERAFSTYAGFVMKNRIMSFFENNPKNIEFVEQSEFVEDQEWNRKSTLSEAPNPSSPLADEVATLSAYKSTLNYIATMKDKNGRPLNLTHEKIIKYQNLCYMRKNIEKIRRECGGTI